MQARKDGSAPDHFGADMDNFGFACCSCFPCNRSSGIGSISGSPYPCHTQCITSFAIFGASMLLSQDQLLSAGTKKQFKAQLIVYNTDLARPRFFLKKQYI
eukprot:TRINITY_DN27984_c0_g1_i1.p2 TRINITY_DN27984_c0_g1~~TRINITY_DN27984_c0_g1_i1.p2  ORF type:complete len:101 (+),score=13.37 TRINITY_DN27984_c0_g1_i1:340-642(+)